MSLISTEQAKKELKRILPENSDAFTLTHGLNGNTRITLQFGVTSYVITKNELRKEIERITVKMRREVITKLDSIIEEVLK